MNLLHILKTISLDLLSSFVRLFFVDHRCRLEEHKIHRTRLKYFNTGHTRPLCNLFSVFSNDIATFSQPLPVSKSFYTLPSIECKPTRPRVGRRQRWGNVGYDIYFGSYHYMFLEIEAPGTPNSNTPICTSNKIQLFCCWW